MQTKDLKFAVIGGDERFIYLAESLAKSHFEVSVYGFSLSDTDFKYAVKCPTLSDALMGVDCVILPLPYTKDGVSIRSPYSKHKIAIGDVFSHVTKNTLILAGKCDKNIEALSASHKCELIDYIRCEDIAILNTVPTAEGAIEVALQNTVYTLHDSNVAVCGFGRVGSILCHKLSAMGAHVTVGARRSEVLCLAKAYGYKTICLENLKREICKFDIVFNTVPSVILTNEVLDKTKETTLIIDLASSPGGVDIAYAEKKGVKVFSALGLPGKCAPKTAGEILKDGITELLEKR